MGEICCTSANGRARGDSSLQAQLGGQAEVCILEGIPCGGPWMVASRRPFLVCSGGHFNPAVSLAATLVGGLNAVLLIPYWVSQVLGGLIGATLAKVGEHCWDWAGGLALMEESPSPTPSFAYA